MEYVAAGDVAAEGVHMLSTGGMLKYAESLEQGAGGEPDGQVEEPGLKDTTQPPAADLATHPVREAVVATETGMLYPLRMAAPDVEFIPANAEASCVFMKMITLPKLRDALREMRFEVKVDPQTCREGAGADRPDGGDRVDRERLANPLMYMAIDLAEMLSLCPCLASTMTLPATDRRDPADVGAHAGRARASLRPAVVGIERI